MTRFPCEERGEGFVLFRKKKKIQYGRTGDAEHAAMEEQEC